jgi:protein-tyrosine-phosphatase|tara:strand:+ start:924 stop:1307 length:384 start_codon:yes stop_codon:yes gene_type:complete
MKKVVFLCVENSCRSQIAEAFANIHGKEKILAFSAGSKPSGTINPKAISLMTELNYDLSTHQSIHVDKLPDVEIDAMISMGCGDSCPSIRAKERIEWDIPDPKEMEYQDFKEVIKNIERKVLDFLKK